MAFFIWFMVFAILVFYLGQLLGVWLDRPRFRLFFLPGFVLVYVARFLGCLVGQAEVQSTHLLTGDRQMIEHKPSRVPWVGPLFIGLIPLVVVAVAYFALDSQFGSPVPYSDELPVVEFRLASIEAVVDACLDHAQAVHDTLLAPGFSVADNFVFLWLVTSLLLAAGPQPDHMRPLLAFLLAGCLVAIGADWLGLSFGFLSRGWFLDELYGDHAWERFSYLVGYTVFLLIAGGLLRLGVVTFKALRPKHPDE